MGLLQAAEVVGGPDGQRGVCAALFQGKLRIRFLPAPNEIVRLCADTYSLLSQLVFYSLYRLVSAAREGANGRGPLYALSRVPRAAGLALWYDSKLLFLFSLHTSNSGLSLVRTGEGHSIYFSTGECVADTAFISRYLELFISNFLRLFPTGSSARYFHSEGFGVSKSWIALQGRRRTRWTTSAPSSTASLSSARCRRS